MKLTIKITFIFALCFFVQGLKAQEGLPVYSDYLTDNYYLIHPSMAGVANCNNVGLALLFLTIKMDTILRPGPT